MQPVIVLTLTLLTIGNAYAEPAQTFDLILRGNTLYDRRHAEFLVVGSTLHVGHSVSMEGSGQYLVGR